MQNFTLGKKGISMLFFAFILLIGSSPSFGQTCPSDANTPPSQSFCFLSVVSDIVTTPGNDVYLTADRVNDTQPLPDNQVLDNQGEYYVGESTGTCPRQLVTITINAETYPNNRLLMKIVLQLALVLPHLQQKN